MPEHPLERAVRQHTRRSIASVLHVKDKIGYLEPEDSAALRSAVLRELNGLADLCVDLLIAAGPADGINELFVRQIQDIHEAVVPLDGRLNTPVRTVDKRHVEGARA